MSDLQDKVKRSIKVLRMYRGDEPIEVIIKLKEEGVI